MMCAPDEIVKRPQALAVPVQRPEIHVAAAVSDEFGEFLQPGDAVFAGRDAGAPGADALGAERLDVCEPADGGGGGVEVGLVGALGFVEGEERGLRGGGGGGGGEFGGQG